MTANIKALQDLSRSLYWHNKGGRAFFKNRDRLPLAWIGEAFREEFTPMTIEQWEGRFYTKQNYSSYKN